jgi:hypothetical protein
LVQDDGPVGLDGVEVGFDDERAVAHAGVALIATLADRLGLEASSRRPSRLAIGRDRATRAPTS